LEEGRSSWQVWVKDDDKLEAAQRELGNSRANPSDPRYNAAGRAAERVREQQVKKAKRLEKNFIDVRTRWMRPAGGVKPLTTTLIVMCCIVGAVTSLGRDRYRLSGCTSHPTAPTGSTVDWDVVKEPQHRLGDLGGNSPWTGLAADHADFHSLRIPASDFQHVLAARSGSMIEHYKGMIFLAVLILISAVVFKRCAISDDWPGGGGDVRRGLCAVRYHLDEG